MTPLCATCGASIHDPGRAPFRYPGPTHDPMCRQCHLAPRAAEVVTCVECGMLDDPDGYVGGGRLRRRSLCFSCDLWTDRITEAIEPGTVIVGGTYYGYDPAAPVRGGNPSLLGHAGRRFSILLADGSMVTTNNLWCGGSIPEHFRDRIPDNARWVDPAQAITEVAGRVRDAIKEGT